MSFSIRRLASAITFSLIASSVFADDLIKINHRYVSSMVMPDMNKVTIELSVSNISRTDVRNVNIESQELIATVTHSPLNIDLIPFGTTWVGIYEIETPFENVYFQKGSILNLDVKIDTDELLSKTYSVTSTYGE